MPLVKSIKVMKFGGTSVGTPERLRRVTEIVRSSVRTHRVVVVASAIVGVTDTLVAAWDALVENRLHTDLLISGLESRHVTLAEDILEADDVATYLPVLQDNLARLKDVVDEAGSAGCSEPYRDALIAMGERLSVPLVALALHRVGLQAAPFDSASLIRTDDTFGEAIVDVHESHRLMRRWFAGLDETIVPVVTGYIGSTALGETTTLGRGGSDYSAALIASGLGADVMERWTDTDGVYTEDPRANKDARRLDTIILEEAWAWNQAGKLGMHRKALDPLVAASIPVHVRCTATPNLNGTFIVPAGHVAASHAAAM